MIEMVKNCSDSFISVLSKMIFTVTNCLKLLDGIDE